MADLPQTNIVPGIQAGIAHAISNATQTMSYANGLAKTNATQTQGGMQQIATVTTAAMVAQIMG